MENSIQAVIYKLCGKATSICLGPILVYGIAGLLGLPDDPAVLQPIRVMPKQQVLPSPG